MMPLGTLSSSATSLVAAVTFAGWACACQAAVPVPAAPPFERPPAGCDSRSPPSCREGNVAPLGDACSKGRAASCTDLGNLFATGNGVGKDERRAVALFTRACDAGDAAGCSNLGIMFVTGVGVGKDEARAAALFTRACDGGIPLDRKSVV